LIFFFFTKTAPTEIYTLSLHDALPICADQVLAEQRPAPERRRKLLDREVPDLAGGAVQDAEQRDERDELGQDRCVVDRPEQDARSEEHTSELQSPCNLVCRLLLEKKKK